MTEANSVKARKLYVGNLPLDMSVNEQSIKEFFDTAMLAAFPDIKVPPSRFPLWQSEVCANLTGALNLPSRKIQATPWRLCKPAKLCASHSAFSG